MDSFYILVMDKNNPPGQSTWFITDWDAGYERLKSLASHNDQISRVLPQTLYPGQEFCKVTLVNAHNGKEELGRIYAVQKTG